MKTKIFLIATLFFLINTNFSFAYEPNANESYNSGIVYVNQKKYDNAIVSFKEAIALNPNFINAYYKLGDLYLSIGQREEALNVFKAALEKNPSNDKILYKIALIEKQKGNKAEAQKYINQMKIKPAVKTIKKKPAPPAFEPPPSIEEPFSEIKNLKTPTGISKDSSGNLYVANYSENSLVQINPKQEKLTLLKGKPLNGPIGIAIDKFDNIYIANYLGGNVLQINPSGQVTTVIKDILKPYYLYIDDLNTLYISEQGTNSIIKIKLP